MKCFASRETATACTSDKQEKPRKADSLKEYIMIVRGARVRESEKGGISVTALYRDPFIKNCAKCVYTGENESPDRSGSITEFS